MKWLKSKSFWGAVIVGVGSVVRVVKPEWEPVIDTIIGLGASLGIIGVAHKIEKAKPGQ